MLIYYLLLVFLALPLVQGQSRVIQRDLTATNFAKTIKGKKLSGNVIKEIEVTSLLNCQIECVKETRCLSYNFKATTDKAPSTCYLSDSDRFRSLANFTKDDEVLYGGYCCLSTFLSIGKWSLKVTRVKVQPSVRSRLSKSFRIREVGR